MPWMLQQTPASAESHATWLCPRCGRLTTARGSRVFCGCADACWTKAPARPPLWRLVARFTWSLVWHAFDFFRKRSAKEVAAIFDQHCAKCDLFLPDSEARVSGRCGKCYCRVSRKPTWRNMIRWRSKKCSDNRWQ